MSATNEVPDLPPQDMKQLVDGAREAYGSERLDQFIDGVMAELNRPDLPRSSPADYEG